MKKLFIIFSFAVLFSASVSAKTIKTMKSSVSYYSVPILKVLDSRDAFVIIYAKNKLGTGTVVVPKKWCLPTTSKDDHVKLMVRTVNSSEQSYMSVFKKDGEFYRVVLNVPFNKQALVWGVLDRQLQVEGADKDTLEDLDM